MRQKCEQGLYVSNYFIDWKLLITTTFQFAINPTIINRPGVAEAVLQTASSLIN